MLTITFYLATSLHFENTKFPIQLNVYRVICTTVYHILTEVVKMFNSIFHNYFLLLIYALIKIFIHTYNSLPDELN